MASDRETLQRIRTQVLELLAAITESPKPSYAIDGQQVSWGDYLRQLQASVQWCDRQLEADEPFEFHTRGGTA